MSDLPTWEVDLIIHGPIKVKERVYLREPKGFNLQVPFQSEILIKNAPTGIQATVTAYAHNRPSARKVSQFFVGQMLDVLALRVNEPILLSLYSQQNARAESSAERRIVTREEWHQAFYEARLLALSESTFLRALGWYRKGLYTEDPLDSFLAYWNSIEIVAGKHHPDTERAKNGSKSQIWECFKALWGECDHWPIIPGNTKWIDENYDVRKSIAHGTEPISVAIVEDVICRIPQIREVACLFLSMWRSTKLDLRVPDGLLDQFGY